MTVRFLHCSDTHLRQGMLNDLHNSGRVINTFLKTVEANRPFDFVFFTGDLSAHGIKTDYDEAEQFIDKLCLAAAVDKNQVWLVPGNHDLERDKGKFIDRTLNSKDASDAFFKSTTARRNHLYKFNEYKDFLSNNAFPGRSIVDGDVVHEPSIISVDGNHRIGILPLNSAWFSIDDSDHGKLWVGSRFISERAQLLRNNKAEIIIAIVHHPQRFMHDKEDAWDYLRAYCNIILTGHIHSTNAEHVTTVSGGAVELSAGTLYESLTDPKRAYFGEIDFNSSGNKLTIRPIMYRDTPDSLVWMSDLLVFGTESLTLPIQPSLCNSGSIKSAVSFPHTNWLAVNAKSWQSDIEDWFKEAYTAAPNKTIRTLILHIVEILRNSNGGIQSQHPQLLAQSLLQTRNIDPHHRVIFDLLKSGLHAHLSHLFMIPAVNVADLIDNAYYAKVLLATRMLLQGHSDEVLELTKGITCCIAEYTAGQAHRRLGHLYEANIQFETLEKRLAYLNKHPCPINSGGKCICDYDLICASTYRARAVVFRKQKNIEAAKTYFLRASQAIDSAFATNTEHPLIANTLSVEIDSPRERVRADIHYSEGYFYYEQNDYEQASKLFKKAIQEVDQSNTIWDSPYTREAIVRLLLENIEEAMILFIKAKNDCESTFKINREAILSFALCSLGLQIIKNDYGLLSNYPDFKVLAKLESALRYDPPLSKGPIECHLMDVEKLTMRCKSGKSKNLAEKFKKQLIVELKKLGLAMKK